MYDLLPSYESSTDRSPCKFVAEYLPVRDLCSAAFVCRKWHETFTPWLWGNPTSHFHTQDDMVYAALTRFMATLPYVRLPIRKLTHTLHLPPAHAESYGGLHAEWLRACLEYLPQLQCLLVHGLPFFDHASLLYLRYPSLQRKLSQMNAYPMFGLRLLDATGCANATSTGLADALTHFPELVCLDLSRTPAARDDVVLENLKFLPHLRALGLKGLNLEDKELSILSRAIGSRVRSLDISDNNLTDRSVRLLLNYCMKEKIVQPNRCQMLPAFGSTDHAHENERVLGFRACVIQLYQKLTYGFAGSLFTEESTESGIIHLYITKNAITIQGASELLRSGRLEALDIGELAMDVASGLDTDMQSTPELASILSEYGSTKLRYLRIEHRIVTEDAGSGLYLVSKKKLDKDVSSFIPRTGNQFAVTEPQAPESSAIGRAVLEASTASVDPQDLCRQTDADFIQRTSGLPVASPVQPSFDNSDEANLYLVRQSLGRDIEASENEAVPEPSQDILSYIRTETMSRRNSMQFIQDRRARLDFRQSQENSLHPGTIPRVHTLVLTKVPTVTKSKDTVERIIQYIKDAAEEASIARERARHTYMLPPGRNRGIAEREYADGLFALQRIVLEMALPEAAPKKASTSWRASPNSSLTGDQDSEAFWEAAKQDFSFFGNAEEVVAREVPSVREGAPSFDMEPLLDVAGELGEFRKAQKTAHEVAEEEWWPGTITVLRKKQAGPGTWDGGAVQDPFRESTIGW